MADTQGSMHRLQELFKRGLPYALVGLLGTLPALASVQERTDSVQERTQVGSSEVDSSDWKRQTDRLLHLGDGRVLRGPSKWKDGQWLLQQGKSWTAIPGELVTRVAIERRVVREAKERGRTIQRDDTEALLALAEWMHSEGLYREVLRKLDRVLKDDPDQERAHALLERTPLRIAMPSLNVPADELDEALGELFRVAAYMPPTGRERAVDELGRSDARTRTLEVLGAELLRPEEGRRAFAALALRRLYPGEYIPRLLGRSVYDVSRKVRRQASYALRDLSQPGLAAPILKAANESEHPVVRMNAAETLGNMGYPIAVEPLISTLVNLAPPKPQGGGSSRAPAGHVNVNSQVTYVGDYDLEIAQGASIADPIINVVHDATILEARSHGISGYTMITHRRVIRNSLQQLTGQRLGDTTAAWTRWWEAKGEGWKAKNLPAAKGRESSGD